MRIEPVEYLMSAPALLAAVDLGSNSFRMLIGRVDSSAAGHRIIPIDNLKETVRLAAGLTRDGQLDADAQQRAIQSLLRFGERLRSFRPDSVRAVATSTLRLARNARHVLTTLEAALGFPIQVIAGQEEARLIYAGAAHALPLDGENRLLVDIGGGSTECVIGCDYAPLALESANVGCLSLSRQFFVNGEVSAENFGHALYTARSIIAPIAVDYRRRGWSYAVGTSGTAKSLIQAVQANFGTEVMTREHLASLTQMLLKAGHADRAAIAGIKPERRPVLAGGLAAMSAVFDELGVESMRYCNGALRQGVLYDLLGRGSGADMREVTVQQMGARYAADAAHGARVADTARALFGQAARASVEELERRGKLLAWAARLAEIGMAISHEDFHKHTAYILRNADMPGFVRDEQELMAQLALGQTGGLRKLRGGFQEPIDWLMVMSLRLASILHRRRDLDPGAVPALFHRRGRVRIEVARTWAQAHPLSDESFGAEAELWNELGVFEDVGYQRL